MKNNIAYYRKLRGLSQTELAKLAGYSTPAGISRVETGVVDLPSTKVKKIAEILDVSPVTLMGLDDEDFSSFDSKMIAAYHKAPYYVQQAIKDLLRLEEQ